MLHCGGGPGPAAVDWLALLDGWVQGKRAPASVSAYQTPGATSGPSQLLCPYPGVARTDGKGGWTCPATKRKG